MLALGVLVSSMDNGRTPGITRKAVMESLASDDENSAQKMGPKRGLRRKPIAERIPLLQLRP
jgi:hypothetical protein